MEKNIEISLLLDFYGELLKPSVRETIDLYYNDDLSLAEVAAQCGITRQGVRDSVKRGEAQLFAYEEKSASLRTGWTKYPPSPKKSRQDHPMKKPLCLPRRSPRWRAN